MDDDNTHSVEELRAIIEAYREVETHAKTRRQFYEETLRYLKLREAVDKHTD